jgi:hypothetical protein
MPEWPGQRVELLVVHKDDGDPGGLGLLAQAPGEGGSGAPAAFLRLDVHQVQVRGGGGPHHRRQPPGLVGRPGVEQPGGGAVAFGQPDPGAGGGERGGGIAVQRPGGVRPFGDGAEVRVEPDDLQAQAGDRVQVGRADPATEMPGSVPVT